MGGDPTLATVSLALTGDELVSDLEALYRGYGHDRHAGRDGAGRWGYRPDAA